MALVNAPKGVQLTRLAQLDNNPTAKQALLLHQNGMYLIQAIIKAMEGR